MAEQRLTKNHRLLKPAEFRRVFDCAQRARDQYFTVLRRANSVDHFRLGLAVAKKTDKRAVVRNRIKRQVRETFRKQIPAPQDYVVISNAAAAKATGLALRRSLANLLEKLARQPKPRDTKR